MPNSHLDLLAEKGFYGLVAPEGLSLLDFPDYAAVRQAVEALASGCLTTTFVWVQHHGAVAAAAETENPAIRDAYLSALAGGQRRAGMAIGSAVRPGLQRCEPKRLTAVGCWMGTLRGSPAGA